MDNDVKKIMDQSKQITLSDKEKATMRVVLMNFVDSFGEQPAPANSFFAFFLRPALALAIVLLLLCGSVSFAAQRSLPGDLLYPIKIHVNEEVSVLLAFSPQAKVAKRLEYSHNRLQVAEKLAATGKLSADTVSEINGNFEHAVAQVQQDIKQLQADKQFSEATKANVTLEFSLTAHQTILANLEQNKETAKQLAPLRESVRTHLSEAKQARQEDEHKIVLTADVKAQERVKEESVQARQELANIEAQLTQQPAVSALFAQQIHLRLQEAQSVFDRGSKELSGGQFSEAFIHFQQVHAQVQAIEVLIAAQTDLKGGPTPSQDTQEQHASSTTLLNINF